MLLTIKRNNMFTKDDMLAIREFGYKDGVKSVHVSALLMFAFGLVLGLFL